MHNLTRKDVEFAGPYGRAIVRRRDGFYELVWRDLDDGVVAKLYLALQAGSEARAVADALKCVHENIPPPPGSRSMRRITKRGLAPYRGAAE